MTAKLAPAGIGRGTDDASYVDWILKGEKPANLAVRRHIYESYFDSQNNSVHPWSLRDEIAGGIADLRLRKAGKPT